MRYHDRETPRTDAEFAAVRRRWQSLGWTEIPPDDEPGIQAAWAAHLQPPGVRNIVAPRPTLSWDGLRELPEDIETDFTLKLLAAFRRCTRPGERLIVIDWQHEWYYFDPRGGVERACRDEWAMPVLPDGDAYHFLAPDFRFGVVTGWQESGPVTLFGQELLEALRADPPALFLKACGPGVATAV